MLISHRYKFIYLKARKVAGTSIEAYLERYCVDPEFEASHLIEHNVDLKDDEFGLISARKKGRNHKVWYNHKPAYEIKELLDKDIWDSYTKICNVRNPYDMMVSWYHHKNPTKKLLDKEHFHNFLLNKESMDVIAINKDIWSDSGNYNFNYIRFENLEEDLYKIMDELDLPKYDYEVPFFKKSKRADWREYYNDESLKIVEDMFSKEMEIFNY